MTAPPTARSAGPPAAPQTSPLAALAASMIALAPIILSPQPALAQQWQLTYRVHVGGIAVLDAQAGLALAGDRYSVQVDAVTDGFLGRMFPWETHARSVGAFRPDGVTPLRHTQVSTLRGKPRNVTLDYDGRGNVRAEVTPPPDADDRDPVPDTLRRATFDPLSGVVGMLLAGLRGEGCQRTVPVFDGRRRYDVHFTDQGMQMVGASRYSVFAGAARQCRISYTPVAGYNRKPDESFWRRNSNPQDRAPVDVWIAPVTPGGPPLPVRLETDSGLGSVVIHLTSANMAPQTAERPSAEKP